MAEIDRPHGREPAPEDRSPVEPSFDREDLQFLEQVRREFQADFSPESRVRESLRQQLASTAYGRADPLLLRGWRILPRLQFRPFGLGLALSLFLIVGWMFLSPLAPAVSGSGRLASAWAPQTTIPERIFARQIDSSYRPEMDPAFPRATALAPVMVQSPAAVSGPVYPQVSPVIIPIPGQ